MDSEVFTATGETVAEFEERISKLKGNYTLTSVKLEKGKAFLTFADEKGQTQTKECPENMVIGLAQYCGFTGEDQDKAVAFLTGLTIDKQDCERTLMPLL